jgi:hypothetical protein
VISFLRHGFLNPQSPAILGLSAVALGMVPPSSAPTVISRLDPGRPWASDLRAKGTSNLVSTPQKVKGRRELLNLEFSINYEAKGLPLGGGKASLRLSSADGVEGIWVLLFCGIWDCGLVGFWVCGVWV